MKITNETLVVALTAPIGGGVVIESKNSGYLNSEGFIQVREALVNAAKVNKVLENAPSKYEVELKDISIIEGLLKITEQFKQSIVCRIHRVPFIPQSAELIKMGFTGNDCYERAQRLYEKVEFHEWIPDYIRQMIFSTEVCGKLVVISQKDAEEQLPHCVKVIGYLKQNTGIKSLFI